MIQAVAIVGAVLALSVVVCVLVIRKQTRTIKTLRAENVALEMEKASLDGEIKRLSKAEKIKSKNRRESDEKIEYLHSGDAVDNAILGLSNGEGRVCGKACRS